MNNARKSVCALKLAAATAASLVPCAIAQTQGSADKSVFSLLNPTPRELMREMSTDRPDTTESPYTVDAGHFQIEISAFDFGYDRNNEDSVTRRAVAIAPMLLKAGLFNNVDLQLGLDPYTWERSTDRSDDSTSSADGFGDTIIRLKVNVWGNDGGESAFAVMPFIKLPTAHDDLGNDEFEGGIILPYAITLSDRWGLGLMAELDINRSSDDDRYVFDLVHTATVAYDFGDDLGGYLEYAGFVNLNGDEDYRALFDAGVTYGLTEDIQLDAGIRVGLTEAAEDFGIFTGVSLRF